MDRPDVKDSAWPRLGITPRRLIGYTVRNGEVIYSPIVSRTMGSHTGGLVMSVHDMAVWDQALYGDQVLGEESKEAVWSAHLLEDGQNTKYGMGWMVSEFLGHRVFMHDGSVDGFLSAAWRLPDERIFVAVLSNSDSPGVGPNIAVKEILAALIGIPEKQAKPMTPSGLDRYAGTCVRNPADDPAATGNPLRSRSHRPRITFRISFRCRRGEDCYGPREMKDPRPARNPSIPPSISSGR